MPLILNPQAIRRLALMGTRQHFDLGGDAPAPDPAIGEAAKSNVAIAGRMQDMAERQYGDQQALFKEYSPLLRDMLQKSVVAQDKSTQQSDSAWADYNATWKPVEQKLAAESLAFGSPGRLEQEAQRAGGAVRTQVDQALRQNEVGLQMAGASPEKIAALQAAGRVSGAKAIGGAEYAGRKAQETAAMGMLDNAARFGRNMTSTGLETARLAGAQTQQVQGGVSGLQGAAGVGAQQAGSLFSGAVGANTAAGNMYLQQYNAQAQADAASKGVFGDLLGAGAGLLGMSKTAGGASGLGMFLSSKKLKHMGKKVDGHDAEEAVEQSQGHNASEERAEGKKGHNAREEAAEMRNGHNAAEEAVEQSPARRWAYKPGLGDGSTKRRMGPTAESLAAAAPEVSDGRQVDGIAMLGLHHAAIGSQSKRLKRIEKKLGLADARGY